MNVLLPDAASLERTGATCATVEKMPAQEESIETFTAINGFSMLTNPYSPNFDFFLVSMKPWGKRPETTVAQLMRRLEQSRLRYEMSIKRTLPNGMIFNKRIPCDIKKININT